MSFSTSLLPSNAVSYPFHATPPPFSASRRLYLPLNASLCLLTPFSRPLVPLVRLLPPPHCLSTSLSRLLIPLHWPVMLFRLNTSPSPYNPFISLWWCLIIKTLLELDYPVKITHTQGIGRLKSYLTLIFTFWPIDLQNKTRNILFSQNNTITNS